VRSQLQRRAPYASGAAAGQGREQRRGGDLVQVGDLRLEAEEEAAVVAASPGAARERTRDVCGKRRARKRGREEPFLRAAARRCVGLERRGAVDARELLDEDKEISARGGRL